MRKLGFFSKSLSLGKTHFIAFATLATLTIYFSHVSALTIPAELRGSLFSGKIAVASITIATMTFYYRTFWDSIESAEKTLEGKLKRQVNYADVVGYYSSGFILLFGGAFFAFVSLGVELYTSLIDKSLLWVHVHMGLFFTCLILLFVFLILFLGRTLGEMQTLKDTENLQRKQNENEN
jgi:hypothetical protein